jgi:hypothetical protein
MGKNPKEIADRKAKIKSEIITSINNIDLQTKQLIDMWMRNF